MRDTQSTRINLHTHKHSWPSILTSSIVHGTIIIIIIIIIIISSFIGTSQKRVHHHHHEIDELQSPHIANLVEVGCVTYNHI